MTKDLTETTIHAWIQLHRAHRRLLETVEQALKSKGLPPLDWYDVLIELHREKDRGLRQYEIGEKILLAKHNLSRLIDRLEKNQLIQRQACAEDGRGHQIFITANGEKMLKQIWPVYSQSIQDSFGIKLTPTEMVKLSSILDNVLASTDLAR